MLTIQRKKLNCRGLNIVEIMVAMVILMIALMALGFVYPRGRLLTDSSRMAMQATEIARSITEEIKNMPLRTNASIPAGPAALEGIGLLPAAANGRCIAIFTPQQRETAQWPYHHFSNRNDASGIEWKNKIPINCWSVTTFGSYDDAADFQNTNPKNFFLPSEQISLVRNSKTNVIEKGILVNSTDGINNRLNIVSPTGNIPELTSIAVTVAWIESRTEGVFVNHITLTSMITENIYKY